MDVPQQNHIAVILDIATQLGRLYRSEKTADSERISVRAEFRAAVAAIPELEKLYERHEELQAQVEADKKAIKELRPLIQAAVAEAYTSGESNGEQTFLDGRVTAVVKENKIIHWDEAVANQFALQVCTEYPHLAGRLFKPNKEGFAALASPNAEALKDKGVLVIPEWVMEVATEVGGRINKGEADWCIDLADEADRAAEADTKALLEHGEAVGVDWREEGFDLDDLADRHAADVRAIDAANATEDDPWAPPV